MSSNVNSVHFKKILCPIDGSEVATKAAKFAIHLTQVENAQLVILNITDDIKQGGAIGLQAKYGNMKLVEGFKKVKEESARQLIRPIEEAAKKKGIANLKTEILYNDKGKLVIELINRYAKQNDIDLIIIGTRHQSKFRQLLLGDVVYGVISHSSCPVLVVR